LRRLDAAGSPRPQGYGECVVFLLVWSLSHGEGIGNAGTDGAFAARKGSIPMRTAQDAKAMAKSIRQSLAEKKIEISHSEALEIVARQFGYDTWNILSAKLETKPATPVDGVSFTQPIPIVRIFDEARALDFYLGFLGFTVDWQHRFHEGAPLYCQISLGGMRLHLSEHSGDASPGCNSVVYMTGVEAWQKSLVAKDYKYNRPGLQQNDWGLECQVIDPFGNRIRFMEP